MMMTLTFWTWKYITREEGSHFTKKLIVSVTFHINSGVKLYPYDIPCRLPVQTFLQHVSY